MTALIQGTAGKDSTRMNPATDLVWRIRRAQWLVLSMLGLSLLLVVLGAYTTTRTESLSVAGYASGVILTLAAFLGLLGLHLEENRKQLLTAAVLFLSLGIVTSFFCLLIDGVCVVLNMDMRPLSAGRCQYYTSGSSYVYENFYTAVPCRSLEESCTMTVRSGTCYCCDLFHCANGDYLNNYYEFVGVESCDEVFTLYVLIWTLSVLNLVAFFLGVLTSAVLGSIRDWKASSFAEASSPTAPVLKDPTAQHRGSVEFFLPGHHSAGSQSFPSSVTSLRESNPPPFNPLLAHRVHSSSA